MHKTLAENDENIKAKKRAAKQQVRPALLGGMWEPHAFLHASDTGRGVYTGFAEEEVDPCVGQCIHACFANMGSEIRCLCCTTTSPVTQTRHCDISL